jgi:uncharacterized protein
MSIDARLDAISPHELARAGGRYVGEVAITAFPRLSGLVAGAGAIAIALEFRRDERARSVVEGSVRMPLTLECQRCRESVARVIDVPVRLCVAESEAQAAEWIDEMDAFVLPDEDVSIVELIEDDLLLALPSQVCQAYEECPRRPELSYPAAGGDVSSEAVNPFGVLAKLKAGGD